MPSTTRIAESPLNGGSRASPPEGGKAMDNFNLVRYHVRCSIRAAIAETHGIKEEAERLRAQGNLRLIIMSDDELRELARILSSHPSRPAGDVYDELLSVVEEQRRTAFRWIGALTARPFGAISKN